MPLFSRLNVNTFAVKSRLTTRNSPVFTRLNLNLFLCDQIVILVCRSDN